MELRNKTIYTGCNKGRKKCVIPNVHNYRIDKKNSIINIASKRINISTLQELCKMRDGILYSGLTTQEIEVLIDFICTEDMMPIP